MADNGRRLSSDDRETLLRTARSRQSSHGVAIRARLVVDCADLGVAEAARRSSVSRATAAKWWRRYLDAGVDGLHDVPHTGRPPAPDEVVRRVLTCALDEPPAGTERWTTRTVADVAGVSQATVSRIRRRYFRRLEPKRSVSGGPLDVHPHLRRRPPVGMRTRLPPVKRGIGGRDVGGPDRRHRDHHLRSTAPLAGPWSRRDGESTGPTPSRCSAERPNGFRCSPTVTLIIDAELDAAARQWLSRHPEIKAHAVTGDGWLGMLHRVADAVDPQQLAELREVQRLIRLARRDAAEEFTWCRATATSSSAAHTASDCCDRASRRQPHPSRPGHLHRHRRRESCRPAIPSQHVISLDDRASHRVVSPMPSPSWRTRR